MLEIYNETIRDLLAPGRSNNFESSRQCTIKHDPHGNIVSDLTIIDVFGIADVTSLLEKASQSRWVILISVLYMMSISSTFLLNRIDYHWFIIYYYVHGLVSY